MRKPLSTRLKEQVARRADFCCEYCRLDELTSFYTFHVDHIKSIKHGGLTKADNLAYCCPDCNFFKGTDIATSLTDEDELIRFFNPRKDKWGEHFDLVEAAIIGKTPIGVATEKIFKFNEPERLIFRRQLMELELYPTF